MDSERDLAQTASLVNESRRRREDVSRDRFAKLWIRESASALWDEMVREVNHSEIELALRNRFFLDRIDYFLNVGAVEAFINIGAGFTSYPFLTAKACPCAEVDLPHVIEYKKDHVAQWHREGLLPDRQVHYHGVDLRVQSSVTALIDELQTWLEQRPSFILMEGLSYYLPADTRSHLLNALAKLQPDGSILAFDFWTQQSMEHPVTKGWRRYLACKGWHDEDAYSPLEIAEVTSIPGYQIVELTNVQVLAGVFAANEESDTAPEVLPEYYAVLQRPK